MALRLVYVSEISVVDDVLDPRLKRQDLVVARRHYDGAELQTLCKVHGAHSDASRNRVPVSVIQQGDIKAGRLYSRACSL
ncbi:MAG TPA: hypothetical protein VMO26_14305 [Vicinamibacterales bacterium]|nr:hypothetical protein [Vicinamibacterales bacterium]